MEGSVYLKSIPFVFENHGNKLLNALYEQQQKSQLCDVSLVVENINFPAHKAVLAAYSDYFYALFDQGKQTDEAGSKACNVTTIHLSSIAVNTFIPILHYLYTAKLHIFSENVKDIMKTARKLQILTIVKECDRLLSENIALPSVHEVHNQQSSSTIVTQSNSSQSVLYVDLCSEDDDEFQTSSSVSNFSKTLDATIGQTNNASYSVDAIQGSKCRSGRTQKKKGFPKKIQQTSSTIHSMATSNQTSPVHNISTVSPASIFGRVGTNQSSRSRHPSSPMLPVTSSTESIGKSLTSGNTLTINPLSFDHNLDSFGSIFGADSALIMEGIQAETSMLTTSSLATSTAKSSDSLQLQSVFSISPKLSGAKSSINFDEWDRFRDSTSSTTDLTPLTSSSISSTTIIASPSSSLQNNDINPPSVYTCKECFKYFTNLPEAFHHLYSEHSPNVAGSKPASSSLLPNNHTCPHCSRNFNNKNNLKRHILIKHSSDKRFKCSFCGRRYAIRQSLQYHLKSVHKDHKTSIDPSPTTALPSFESTSEQTPASTDTFSYTVVTTNSSIDLNNSYSQNNTTAFATSPSYLAAVTLQTDEDDGNLEVTKGDLPTIQRVESIRQSGAHVNVGASESLVTNATSLKPQDPDVDSNVKAEPRVTSSSTNNKITGNAFPGNRSSSVTLETTTSLASTNSRIHSTSNAHSSPSGNLSYVLPGQPLLPAYTVNYQKNNESMQNLQARVTPRLHRCDRCAKIFSTIHAYTRHRRACNTHVCPVCNRGFSQMGNMRRHIKIFHSDQKPFACKVCNKAYGIQQSFRYHMRDKHGITISHVPESSTKKPRSDKNSTSLS